MRAISSKVLTFDGWVRVDRLVVRVFGKEITLRTTVEKIHIPDNAKGKIKISYNVKRLAFSVAYAHETFRHVEAYTQWGIMKT